MFLQVEHSLVGERICVERCVLNSGVVFGAMSAEELSKGAVRTSFGFVNHFCLRLQVFLHV
jgi:hypothetical protein